MTTLAQQVVLKEGSIFLVSHENGDISGNAGLGLYYKDMRYLSLLSLKINEQTPPLLSFSGHRTFMGTFQYANDIMQLPLGDVIDPGPTPNLIVLPQTLSIQRSRFISHGLHERITVANYNRFPVPISLTLLFGSDFRDLFDVRGFPRDKWGELLPPYIEGSIVSLPYRGQDGVDRNTEIIFDLPPDSADVAMPKSKSPTVEPGILVPDVGAPSYHIKVEPPVASLTWNFTLEPHAPISLSFHVIPRSGNEEGDPVWLTEETHQTPADKYPKPNARFDKAVHQMRDSYRKWDLESATFRTDNEDFNLLLNRSKSDLRLLVEAVGDDYFPSAGVPWYVCPFGRDSLITALQTLTLNPQIAIGTLRVLASYQGKREDPWREEQPGKILHELRVGEMARLGMVPHSPYYGSVDATPLFVLLFVETMRWLYSNALYEELLPNVLRAVDWIDNYGDVDGDGLIEYVGGKPPGGIRNQVWKDSGDSTQFPDGTLAETPFAAAEVQAYVYAAKKGLGELLRRKGDTARANRLTAEAEALKTLFNNAFWMEDSGFFSQGLDPKKVRVPTITSNPGHCLWCGIADEEKAKHTVYRMMQPDMLSGWGIRTISDLSPSYNPMSYHNGSIWPHDNSLVISGFKRYGYAREANRVISQLFEAAQHFKYMRLPELYCGFVRDTVDHTGPAEYPVSCNPQAWAAAAPVLMLQTLLGLEADANRNRVHLTPRFPNWLNTVQISNLRVADKKVDLRIRRIGEQYDASWTGDHKGMELEVT